MDFLDLFFQAIQFKYLFLERIAGVSKRVAQ